MIFRPFPAILKSAPQRNTVRKEVRIVKKYLALLVSALLLVSLCACGQNAAPQEPETPDTPDLSDTATPPTASAASELTPVTSVEEVRALYVGEVTDPAALSITEYEGDYLSLIHI